jgi:hypothetical protein
MVLEALAVLEGGGLVETAEGAARAAKLREVLAFVPEGADPHLREVDRQLRTGGASVALSMLDQRRGLLPPWAARRHAILQEFLLERASPAPVSPSVAPATEFGRALDGALGARDVKLAFQAAREYMHGHPGDADAHAATVALERLVLAMAEVSREMNSAVLRTQPMTGHHVALFQLRMANFDVAERMFRKLVVEDPLDQLARSRLDDIQVIRTALEGVRPSAIPRSSGDSVVAVNPAPNVDPLMDTMSLPDGTVRAAREQARADAVRERAQEEAIADFARSLPEPDALRTQRVEELEVPTMRLDSEMARAIVLQTSEITKEVHLVAGEGPRRPPSSPELLNKRARPAWTERDYLPPAESTGWEEDQSTEIGRPEAHAELLVKQGLLPQALRIFEALAARQPDEPRFRTRIAELQRLMTVLSGRGSIPSPEASAGGRPSFAKAPTEPRPAWEAALVQAPTAPAPVVDAGVLPPGARPTPASGVAVLPSADSGRDDARDSKANRKAPWDDESTVSRDIVWEMPRAHAEPKRAPAAWDNETTRAGIYQADDRSSAVQVRRIILVR